MRHPGADHGILILNATFNLMSTEYRTQADGSLCSADSLACHFCLLPSPDTYAIGQAVRHCSKAGEYSPILTSFNQQIVSALATTYLGRLNASEALYRTIVALGTLVERDSEARDLALALDTGNTVDRIKRGQTEKLDQCLKECMEVLSN